MAMVPISCIPSGNRLKFVHTALQSDMTHGIFVMQTWALHERNELVWIVDPDLNGDFDAEEACRYLKVGLLCTQDAPKLRPSMSTVVKMLTGDTDVNLETLTKPGLISDFMDLKIRSQTKVEGITIADALSSGLSAHDNSPLSSENTTYASITFTAICDRDD